jgi:hypothetical protein
VFRVALKYVTIWIYDLYAVWTHVDHMHNDGPTAQACVWVIPEDCVARTQAQHII